MGDRSQLDVSRKSITKAFTNKPMSNNDFFKRITILMADDDSEDCQFAQDSLKEGRLANDIRFVGNGEELMEYLRHKGQFQNEEEAPMPGLILMDLYMPRMDGLTALKEIRADSKLCKIPLVVLSTSKSDKDIHESYELGQLDTSRNR